MAARLEFRRVIDPQGVVEWVVIGDALYQATVSPGEIDIACYLEARDLERISTHLDQQEAQPNDYVLIMTTVTAIVADAIDRHSSASGGVSHTALTQIRMALARAFQLVDEAMGRPDLDPAKNAPSRE